MCFPMLCPDTVKLKSLNAFRGGVGKKSVLIYKKKRIREAALPCFYNIILMLFTKICAASVWQH